MNQANSTLTGAVAKPNQPAAAASIGNRWPVLSLTNWRELLACTSPSDCGHCDGFGRVYNNADTTSNQFHQCADCGDERGQP